MHAQSLAGCLLCALLLAAAPACAQNFPDKNITLLHAYSPGSSSSVTLRAIGEAATKTLGKKIVVEDKPGAGGALAPTYMLKMGKPDGYTLSQLPQPILRIPHIQKVEFDAVVRIDTPGEADYYRNGGIMQYVLRGMLRS